MKIQPAKIESFVNNKEYLQYAALLIYGQDAGAILHSFKKIESAILPNVDDPFLSAKLDSARVSEEPTIILDELSAISFGGGRRLVSIKNVEGKDAVEAVISALEDITPDISQNSFLLISAGELAATSTLRKFFEAEKNLAVIAHYLDDEKSLSRKAYSLLRAKGIQSDQETCEMLANLCMGDTNILINEVEKLSLYLGDKKSINLDDILLITGNSSETSLQDVVNAVFSGNVAEAIKSYIKGAEVGIVPIAIIRTVQRYLEKLENASNQIKKGRSEEDVVSSMRPPIFFKQVPVFKSHLRRISRKNNIQNNTENNIGEYYHLLYKAECELKESGAEPEIITEQLLQKLAA